MNIHEMRVKYAFWRCSEYSETRMLWSKLTVEEKGSIAFSIPRILKGISTVQDVDNLTDMSFEGRMCLKFALRKVGMT